MRFKDKQLAKRILLKDEEAFNQLYYTYKNLIYYRVSSFCAKQNEIDDIVQEIFIKISENIGRYNNEHASLATWISIITKNHMIDYLKKKEDIIYDNEYIDNVASPEPNNTFDFDDYTVGLTQLEKDVLILKTVYKLSHLEISKALDITIDVSKKTYKKATTKAAEEWKKYEK